MTNLDLTKLREIAEAATTTPGPWSEYQYLLAFDPPTVLELIDEIERLRAKNIQLGLQATTAEHDRKLAYRAMDSAKAKAGALAEQVRTFGGVRYADRPRVDCEIARLRETLATVKAITDGTPECDKYDDKSPVTCGWKFDLQRIKEVMK